MLETIVFLFGGIPGTLHHLYFTGTPIFLIAIGAMSSALEVVPLAMMVLLSLVPAGICQAWASISQGMWFARSPEVIHSPFMATMVWLRVPGDIVFTIGCLCLAAFAVRLLTAGKRTPAVGRPRVAAKQSQSAKPSPLNDRAMGASPWPGFWGLETARCPDPFCAVCPAARPGTIRVNKEARWHCNTNSRRVTTICTTQARRPAGSRASTACG